LRRAHWTDQCARRGRSTGSGLARTGLASAHWTDQCAPPAALLPRACVALRAAALTRERTAVADRGDGRWGRTTGSGLARTVLASARRQPRSSPAHAPHSAPPPSRGGGPPSPIEATAGGGRSVGSGLARTGLASAHWTDQCAPPTALLPRACVALRTAALTRGRTAVADGGDGRWGRTTGSGLARTGLAAAHLRRPPAPWATRRRPARGQRDDRSSPIRLKLPGNARSISRRRRSIACRRGRHRAQRVVCRSQ
jgi:hypothetical protein